MATVLFKPDLKYLLVACLFLFSNLAQAAKPTVFVTQVKATEIFDQVTYPARVVSKINASVLSETEGVITNIIRSLGQPIRRGQTLIRIQHTDPVFQYAPVTVRSPVAGVVSSIEVTEGSRVSKGQKLATVTDPSQIRILIEVAASDLSTVVPGLEGTLQLSGKEKIAVKVVGVSPFVDPGSGTARAELLPKKPKQKIPPGSLGRVKFKVGAHKGVEVPEDAVVYRGKKTFLRLINEGKAKLTAVELGPSRRGKIEIKSGLKEGETVVVRASKYVSDGEAVTVENSKGDG